MTTTRETGRGGESMPLGSLMNPINNDGAEGEWFPTVTPDRAGRAGTDHSGGFGAGVRRGQQPITGDGGGPPQHLAVSASPLVGDGDVGQTSTPAASGQWGAPPTTRGNTEPSRSTAAPARPRRTPAWWHARWRAIREWVWSSAIAAGRWARAHRAGVVAAALLAVIVGGALIGVLLTAAHSARPESTGSEVAAMLPTTSSGVVAESAGTPWCAGQAPAGWMAATSPDSDLLTAGQAVVVRFEQAYYVQRSGAAAYALVAPRVPETAVRSAADIQRGIDTVPTGTSFCAAMSANSAGPAAGVVDVDVHERRPDGTSYVWPQTFHLTTGSNPQILSITSRKAS